MVALTIELIGPFDSSYKFANELLERGCKTDDSPIFALLQLFIPARLFIRQRSIHPLSPWFDPHKCSCFEWRHHHWVHQLGWHLCRTATTWRSSLSAVYKSPTELDNYCKMYINAIDRASSGTPSCIYQNSHVGSTLYIAFTNTIAMGGIINHRSKFVFGSSVLGMRLKDTSLYRSRQSSDLIAQILEG